MLTESQLQLLQRNPQFTVKLGGVKQEFWLYWRNKLHTTQQMTASKQISYSAKGSSFKKKVLLSLHSY